MLKAWLKKLSTGPYFLRKMARFSVKTHVELMFFYSAIGGI